uniref:Putative transcriptional regulator binding to the gc-rich sequence n=1 Tax=Triatoma infestans TaxID=30076 RepID=A0A023EZG3_TRIIF
MSLFKKPKRNIRIRENTCSEDADNENDSEICLPDTKNSKTKLHKPTSYSSVLSFGEDLNEGDDGEVFKVKKSAQSKKIKKLLDKERKKQKEKSNTTIDTTEKTTQPQLDEDIVIKLKNTFPILNGREAIAAVQEGISSEDEEESSDIGPKYIKQSDSVKLLLKKGKIPDAATIHAARKQRQHVREMGEIVPLPEESANRFDVNNKSRLVREDDNDASDAEEERINMAVNIAAEDRIRRKAEFEAAQGRVTDESDKGEDEEWENQQIRKGVTGAQIAAVQQETMYYQQYLGAVGVPMNCEVSDPSHIESNALIFPPLPPTEAMDPQLVITKLKDRLADLREVHRRHTLECNTAAEEIETLGKECDQLKEDAPRLAERFRYYQDLRGYVTDLVECLDEKIVIIELLEQRIESLFTRRVNEYMSRRRQDVMDQAQELAPTSQRMRIEKDEAQIRRVAEREGRRIRRQRVRELKGIVSHIDGMSSDEEITETELITARTQREVIEQDSKHVFEDTLDEFATVRGILERFESWRRSDIDAYREAYVSLCLPKLLGPILRLKLLFWNPFSQGSNIDIEKTPWCNSILLYGLERTETEEQLRKDPDVQLLPRVIERIVLPKLSKLTSLCWDPLSSSQTVSLVGLVTKLIQEYPTITPTSKFLTNLINTVLDKMKEAVENDVFIPIYPQQRLSEAKVNNFFLRQCTVAVKLLGNLVRWQGILSDNILSEIALDSLLNRYLLSAIRTCSPLQAANICQMVGSVLPRIWLQICVHPPQLQQFLNQAKIIAKQLDTDKPTERDALERMSGILKAIS